MTRSPLPAGREVDRPSHRLRRSSSTSSTASKTPQTEELPSANKAPLSTILDTSRKEVFATSQTSCPPPPPAPNQAWPTHLHLSSFPSSYDNTPRHTPSDHSTEGKEDLARLAVRREVSTQALEQKPEDEGYTSRPLSSSNSEREDSAESGNNSTQKIRGHNPTPHPLDNLESSREESDAGDYSSESKSSDTGDIMPQETPLNMRDLLNRHLLFINDKEAKKPGESVIKKAMAILDSKRGSDWSEEKQQEVQEGIEDYCEEAEATFVMNLMEHILGKTRKVPKHTTLSQDKFEQKCNWIEAAWKKDHLRIRAQINFRTDCIPSIRTGTSFWDKLVAEAPRVENPKPDLAFGIYKTGFPSFYQEILNNHRCNLAGPKPHDIFLSCDAKCMNAPIDEAENQCMRSGCAMVETRRGLNQAAKPPRRPKATSTLLHQKPDMESFAFTLAIGSQGANMFVNWALEMDANDKDKVQWHMHKLRVYSYFNLDDLTQLHHDINNILDWGLTTRKAEVEKLCEIIHGLEAIQPQAKKPKSGKDKEEAGAEADMA